jgi:hypothetical protein
VIVAVSRILQYAGLIAPPVSIVLQLMGAVDVRNMLLILVAGLAAFWLGRLLEGYARR